MPRTFRVLILTLASLTILGLISSSFDAFALQKDKKKEDKKDPKVKKDDKDKKEEKKEVFKPDPAAVELKYVEKEKTYWVFAVAFSPDSKTVAAAYRDNAVRVWDLKAKKEILTLKPHPTETKSLAYAKEHLLVSTGAWDKKKKAWEGEIKLWDKDGKSGKSLKGHSDEIESLAVSKDGNSLATASKDQTVKIWNIAEGKETQTIKGHTDKVNSASFSPDGKQVVTTSADKTLRVWNIADAKEVASFKVEREVEVPDPKSKDKKKTIKQKELGREFTNALFTNDGKKVIAGNLDGVIKIYDVEGKMEVKELKAHEGVWGLALSPDGTKLATGGWDGTIKIWNVADGKELQSIKAHLNPSRPGEGGTVTTLSFSANGQSLASGSIDGTVKVWNVK